MWFRLHKEAIKSAIRYLVFLFTPVIILALERLI